MEQLLSLDRELFLWINIGWSGSVLDLVCSIFTHLGGRTAGFVFLLIVLAISRSGWPFLYAGLAYGANAIIFKTIKYTVLRDRPDFLPGAILRQAPDLSGATDPSFPSGHAAIAFMIAVFLSARYRRLSPLFFCAASLVALSRIYLGLHYLSDVVAGALIGILVSVMLLKLGRRQGRLDRWA